MHTFSRAGSRLIPILIGLALLLFAIHQPVQAGHAVTHIWSALTTAGQAFGTFVNAVFG